MTDRPALDNWMSRAQSEADRADTLQQRVLDMVTRHDHDPGTPSCWADSPHHPEPDGYHILGEAAATHPNGLCDYHHHQIVTGQPYVQPPKPASPGRVVNGVLIKAAVTRSGSYDNYSAARRGRLPA